MIPLWIKIGFTLYLAVLLPVYWYHYSPLNYLWFCDVALIMTMIGLWLEDPLLVGAAALSVVLLDAIWTIDLAAGLVLGQSPTGLAAYMLDSKWPAFLRGLSLFHVWLPMLLVWLVWQLGYDARALPLQMAVCWLVLLLSYLLTSGPDGPAGNINWVYGLSEKPQVWMHPWLWVGLLMIVYPLLVYLPTHLVFGWLFGKNTPM